jgi:hypothetical protein
MIVDVLFGCDGYTILGCRSEVPLFQRRKYSLIDGWPEALNHYLLHDGSGLVDCDLDDDVTLNTLRVRPENRVRRYDRQGGANFWAGIASI